MNNSIKMSKYKLASSLKGIGIYYGIFSLVLILFVITSPKSIGTEYATSGLEFSTVIFIFIMAIDDFKSTFYFSQGNNVSRKSYLIGNLVYILTIAAILPIIDISLNRIYNLFVNSPMLYDMSYALKNIAGKAVIDNSIFALFSNYLFLLSFYIFVYLIGQLISTVFFKLKGISKIIFPILVIDLILMYIALPDKIIKDLLGINSFNSFLAVMTFLSVDLILIGGEYLLLRKAEVNENIDKSFELIYFNLSYRRKFIRSLWGLPFLQLLICLIWFSCDNVIPNIIITVFVIVIVIFQLMYNYMKYKKTEETAR